MRLVSHMFNQWTVNVFEGNRRQIRVTVADIVGSGQLLSRHFVLSLDAIPSDGNDGEVNERGDKQGNGQTNGQTHVTMGLWQSTHSRG